MQPHHRQLRKHCKQYFLHFFLPAIDFAAACMAFFSSCCFFLNSTSSSVCSFLLPPDFLRMTSFCALFEVPTGIGCQEAGAWALVAEPAEHCDNSASKDVKLE